MGMYDSKNRGVRGIMSVDDIYTSDGRVFEVSASETVALAVGWSILYFKPASKMHLSVEVETPDSGVVRIYRNPTLSSTVGASTGAILTARNRDDTCVLSSTAKFVLTPLVSSTAGAIGTQIYGYTLQNNQKVLGSKDGRYSKWILGSSNHYGLWFQPTTNATDVNWNLSYVEETEA